jgi:hypothetical protein
MSMQKDDISYKALMETVNVKKQMLRTWTTKQQDGSCPWGPALAQYLNLTKTDHVFGAFILSSKANRDDLAEECSLHVERLLEEIQRRFPPSKLHDCLSYLFDPIMLNENKHILQDATYGRPELDFLRQKYNDLHGFDSGSVQMEWESLKPLAIDFIGINSSSRSPAVFWKDFIQLKRVTHDRFFQQFDNILMLMSIYLISPTNSAECERGYSAANRIQTTGRTRITIDTLDCLLTVRLLLSDDIRR